MPTTDYQGGVSGSLSSLGRSLLSLGRDQVHAVEPTSLNLELGSFQKQVAERFSNLETSNSEELLSIPWLQKLLDVFICCQEEFKAIVFNNGAAFNKPPLDRCVSEFFERSVKALDVCNAIRDGIEQIRQWQKQIEIVLAALDNHRSLGEGQFRRAKKALIDLVISMLDEKELANALAHRNWSLGRNNDHTDSRSMSSLRSLSWSVSRSWSAARQLQAMANNLTAPRPNELLATNGLIGAVFTMNYVLLFVMWALVAAIPCQDRGLQTHFHIPRHYEWASPILTLHERILEDSKKRDRKNASGLLREIRDVEKCVRHMNELMDCIQFPLTDEKASEVKERVQELGIVYDTIKDGLDPLERQVREVFHRIVRSRADGFDSIG